MSYLKHCSTALAALMISTMPTLAQDSGDREGQPRLVFIQVEDQDSTTTNLLIEVRRRAAMRICADDFSRTSRVACTLSEEDAREAGLLDGDGGDGDQDGDEYVDANRGHGNDPDGFDEDNPGQGHGNDRGVGGGNGRGNGNGNRDGGND